MDLLIDVCIAIDVCSGRSPHAQCSAMALQHCLNAGGQLWLYAGSMQTLEYTLYRELKRLFAAEASAPPNIFILQRSRELLQAFAADKHWLAALAGEGDVWDAEDLEEEQLIRALDRFKPGTIQILTRDNLLLQKCKNAVHPEDYLTENQNTKSIDFIDLMTQQGLIRAGLENAIHRVIHHGQYIMGPEIKQLEEKLCEFVGSRHCITCASGTDALLMALMALDIGPGDEVVTVPYTWISTAEVIALLKARPVFVDVQPDTFNMDPDLIEAAITPKTRAIMPVGIYGQCADMTRINIIAQNYNLPVIEDGAQCFGAIHHGRFSCKLSLIGCTSFFPSKPLGCYGDGGAIFTDDDALADKLCQIRIHGQKVKHQHPVVGINGRLDTLQAAILLEKLSIFHNECNLRRQVAGRYDALLAGTAGIRTPIIADGNQSVFAQYTILADNRDEITNVLQASNIPGVAYYTRCLHLQEAFADLGYKAGDFPVAEQVATRCLSLPMSPYVSEVEQEMVAQEIKKGVVSSTL